jgi:hypothetical protein
MKKIGSDHTKRNRATHSDEKGNTINIFRRSNSTISSKLLSFDAGANEISTKNESLKGARRLSRAKKPCHRGPAGKRAGRGCLPGVGTRAKATGHCNDCAFSSDFPQEFRVAYSS